MGRFDEKTGFIKAGTGAPLLNEAEAAFLLSSIYCSQTWFLPLQLGASNRVLRETQGRCSQPHANLANLTFQMLQSRRHFQAQARQNAKLVGSMVGHPYETSIDQVVI